MFCIGPICTHSFDPSASLDAWINIGRGATFGLTDQIANWIVPGASCTVAQDSLDQFIGNAATTLLGGEALGALLRSGRFGELLARIRAIDLADETGSLGRSFPDDLIPEGETRNSWGHKIWGRGAAGAEAAMGARTPEELRALGLTVEGANRLAAFYRAAAAAGRGGEAASARAALMEQIAKELGG